MPDKPNMDQLLLKATYLYKNDKISGDKMPDRVFKRVKEMDKQYSKQQLRQKLQGQTKSATYLPKRKVSYHDDPESKKREAKRINKLYKKYKEKGMLTEEGKETMRLGYEGLGDDYSLVPGVDVKMKEKQAQFAGAGKMLDEALVFAKNKGKKLFDVTKNKADEASKGIANNVEKTKSRFPGMARLTRRKGKRWMKDNPGKAVGAVGATGLGSGYLMGKEGSDKAEKVFQKIALVRPNVSDVERRIGTYFDDELEEPVRQKLDEKSRESFSLRNPWLTGIPTLGIAPMVARDNVIDEVTTEMARAYPALRNHIIEERRHKQRNRAIAQSGAEVNNYVESTDRNNPSTQKEASLDKAEKVFQKMAQEFQGYVSSKEGIPKEKMKKLKSKGYKRVSGEDYAENRGNAVIEGFKNKAKKYDEKVDSQKKGLTAGTGLLGGAIPFAATLDTKLPTKIKAGLVAGGTLLGGAGGYALGRSKEKEYQGKKKEVLKGLKEKADAMKDVYSIEDSGERSFWMKPQENSN